MLWFLWKDKVPQCCLAKSKYAYLCLGLAYWSNCQCLGCCWPTGSHQARLWVVICLWQAGWLASLPPSSFPITPSLSVVKLWAACPVMWPSKLFAPFTNYMIKVDQADRPPWYSPGQTECRTLSIALFSFSVNYNVFSFFLMYVYITYCIQNVGMWCK